MKKYLLTLMVALTALSVVLPEAEAKRMGGGGSVGRQSQNVTRQAAPAQQQAAPAAAQQAAPSQAAAQQAKASSPWKGILGGALLGLGLGALLSHLGIGGALAGMIGNLLMIALLVAAGYFIYRMVTRKQHANAQAKSGLNPAYAGNASPGFAVPEIGSRVEPGATASTAAPGNATDATWTIPADFDSAAFLRHAKTYFIRLQAAWDKADVNDLREFTTPEMYAELKQQLLERGPSPNHTDVVSLEAELLGVESVGTEHVASVKFHGVIRESENAAAEPFTEVWNLSKPATGNGGWVLGGIQQLS
ncbi:MAG TPA: Tim44-like domain-containing protein [Noviherbaspirillum sp.]|uniref:Tim44 domain-containing protein n=1 Tax=Noviherbaspirillum sp. TaxID=1926288 RepID=UPI002D6D9B70|nr:Tim44-like domain-containing protein [Noviherbaspirillum sp.]HYD96796.1 Tim44-like domain-containing protein [Noviherbaspirillum sp.]